MWQIDIYSKLKGIKWAQQIGAQKSATEIFKEPNVSIGGVSRLLSNGPGRRHNYNAMYFLSLFYHEHTHISQMYVNNVFIYRIINIIIGAYFQLQLGS